MEKITLKDTKLEKLLTEKSELIILGRAKSEEIEKIEAEMETIDKEVQEAESKVNIDDLMEKEKAVTEKVNEAIKEMNEIKQEIYDRMKKEVSSELHTRYDVLKLAKDEAETERNQIALKAQKYSDKIIPLSRKLMKPYLKDEYSDYETIQLIDGEIVATLFSHLQEFKDTFAKKNK